MKYLLITLIILGVIYATYFFISSNNTSAIVYKTEVAIKTTIEKKTIATGKVVPEDEVEIKPQISGIIESILVKEGQLIKAGDLIGIKKLKSGIIISKNALEQKDRIALIPASLFLVYI